MDWLGAALLSVALAALPVRAEQGQRLGLGLAARARADASAASRVGAFWVWVETKVDQPLVDMRVLRRRPVLMTNITGVLIGFSMFASFLLVPQLAQTPERFGYGFGATRHRRRPADAAEHARDARRGPVGRAAGDPHTARACRS